MSVTKTIAYDVPSSGDYLEVTAELRTKASSLSSGFSVTGQLWERRSGRSGRARKRQGREADIGGCIHEIILAAAPELEPLVQVHLADPSGLPMHAVANGWYFYSGKASAYERQKIAEGQDYGYSRNLQIPDHERAAHAVGIDPADLPQGLDREGFSAFVDSLADTYRERARRAEELLDSLIDDQGVESQA